MPSTIRADWRKETGPGNMPMPHDPPPTLGDFRHALETHQHLDHEDSQDCLNADGTWGPPGVGVQGGSGIAFGYACDDLGAVEVAVGAVRRRVDFYDGEHWIRQIRYAHAAWDMTHDPKYAREIVDYGTKAVTAFPIDGPVTDDDADVKANLAQYMHYAQKAPHTGLAHQFNGRLVGWYGYSRLMQMKVARTSSAWSKKLYDLCELAAIPGTGQIVTDTRNGIDQKGVQYGFQAAILIHTILCTCRRMGLPVPRWVANWMHAMYAMPVVDYYGGNSMPAFTYTDTDGTLKAATGPGQQADPGCCYWGHNCAILFLLTGSASWLEMANKFGPQTWGDEQSRRDSMLLRGVRQ